MLLLELVVNSPNCLTIFFLFCLKQTEVDDFLAFPILRFCTLQIEKFILALLYKGVLCPQLCTEFFFINFVFKLIKLICEAL